MFWTRNARTLIVIVVIVFLARTETRAPTVLAQAQESPPSAVHKASGAMAACDVSREYVKLINAGQYASVGGLFADDAVYMGPDGKTRHGSKAIGEFYKQLLGNLRPQLRAASFFEQNHDCVMELENRSKKSGKYALAAVDHFTIDPQGKISRFIVFLRPGTETGRDLSTALSKIH